MFRMIQRLDETMMQCSFFRTMKHSNTSKWIFSWLEVYSQRVMFILCLHLLACMHHIGEKMPEGMLNWTNYDLWRFIWHFWFICRIICGLTGFTTKNHIIRAALEAICFQTRDVLEAMKKDCGLNLNKIYVDGVMTSNNLLMQLQADLSGIPVCKLFTCFIIVFLFESRKYLFNLLFTVKSQHQNTTALGVAMAAALADGINVISK